MLLVLNIGSSTITFGVYGAQDGNAIARGAVEGIGHAPRLIARLPQGDSCDVLTPDGDTYSLPAGCWQNWAGGWAG